MPAPPIIQREYMPPEVFKEDGASPPCRLLVYSVSATPFRGGFAALKPPLGHAKVREKKSLFTLLESAIKQYLPKRKKRRGKAKLFPAF